MRASLPWSAPVPGAGVGVPPTPSKPSAGRRGQPAGRSRSPESSRPSQSKLRGSGCKSSESFPAGRRQRGSILLIVLVTVLLTALAVAVFVEKAGIELLAEARARDNDRLRVEAYSALEVTLASLEDFYTVDGGLRSPAEGWGDPLGYAGYVPPEGMTDTVTFEDESGKISLPQATENTLTQLFELWQVPQDKAELLADALMGWMHQEHVSTAPGGPVAADYEQSAIPYDPPYRSLHSFSELAAILDVRDAFYDESGRPNDLWRRFVGTVSLYNFRQPNINGALPSTLAVLGQYSDTQQQQLADYLTGAGQYSRQGPGYFKSEQAAVAITGQQAPSPGFGATIQALRIYVTVKQGRASFRLCAVVAPPGGAKLPPDAPAAAAQAGTSATPSPPPPPAATPAAPAATGTTGQSLQYPFTILEIRENDAIPNLQLTETSAPSS